MTDERVSQNWPEGLKARVRKIVGARGVTDFTVIAVLEKLNQIEAATVEPDTEPEEFFEEDEPLEQIVEAFDRGDQGVTAPSVADLREQLGMVTAADLPIPSTPRCDTCFSPLIDGECWTCDI